MFPFTFPTLYIYTLYTTFALRRSQYCFCELSRTEVFELNQLVLLMLPRHRDPVIRSRTVCYCVRLRSNTRTHTSRPLTCTLYMASNCVWHHLVSTARTLLLRPVNSVSLVTGIQQHLCFINNNTRCVMFHVVLCVSVHACVYARPRVVDDVHSSRVLQLAGTVAQLQPRRVTVILWTCCSSAQSFRSQVCFDPGFHDLPPSDAPNLLL